MMFQFGIPHSLLAPFLTYIYTIVLAICLLILAIIRNPAILLAGGRWGMAPKRAQALLFLICPLIPMMELRTVLQHFKMMCQYAAVLLVLGLALALKALAVV